MQYFSCLAKTLSSDCNKEDFISQTASENYKIQKYDQLSLEYQFDSGVQEYKPMPVLPNGKYKIPKLGEEHVEGMTLSELEDFIKSKVQNLEAVEAFVFRNPAQVTVLGAVSSPGSYSIEGIKTIYEAIGKAGGFNKYANKRKVKLIRHKKDGTRVTHLIDFPKKVFKAYADNSGLGEEKFLLQENDLIFVEKSMIKTPLYFTLNLINVATIGAVTGLVTILVAD